MIKDKIVSGILIGVLADAVKLSFNYLSFRLDFTPVVFWQLVSATILARADISTPMGILVGALVDLIVASMLGVAFVYVVYLTGKENLWLKGLGFGMFVWINFAVIVQGVLISSKITPVPSGLLVTFVAHFIFGLFLAVFTKLLTGDIRTVISDVKDMQKVKVYKIRTPIHIKDKVKNIIKPHKI